MDIVPPARDAAGVSRRNFVGLMAATGASAMLANSLSAQTAAPATAAAKVEDLNVAIIGIGRQGKILLDLALKIPGIRFKAICDIWTYSQKIAVGMCKQAGQEVKVYDDYKAMLDAEKDIQAVLIAVPDFWHAPITNDCLKAGLNVYCEKEMSNTLEAAKSMVLTARSTGKLLQIGHQRRSNPFYRHTFDLMHNDKFCGNVTTIGGQWHQLKALRALPAKLVEKYSIPEATLAKWGFGSMPEFYEWRWFNKYAGGPMTDLGSHQMDVFNWYLKSTPTRVSAVGGVEHALAEAKEQAAKGSPVGFTPECFNMTLATYEWANTQWGKVRGIYQVNLTSSYGGFFEVFQGDRGSIVISEIKDKMAMAKEATADKAAWEDEAQTYNTTGATVMHPDPLASRKKQGKMSDETKKLMADMDKPAHQPHIENFFEAVRSRGAVKLNCPPEIGYETAVTVIKANEAVMTGKTIDFTPEDFKV